MNLRFTSGLALAGCLALAGAVRAQDRLYGPLILRLPAGPRTLALGNTGVASRDDEVIFFNPAQLVQATGFGVSGERFASTAGAGALSAVTRFHGGGIGIGMRFASYRTPEGLPATRASMLEADAPPGNSLEAIVGLGQVVKGIRVGVAAKYVEELTPFDRPTNGGIGLPAATVRVGRPLADIGLSKDLFRMTVGLAVQNIGSSGTSSAPIFGITDGLRTPLRTTLGVSHSRQAGPLDLTVTAAASLLRADFFQPSGGVEANYSWLSGYNIALRAGARRAARGEDPFTAGAGFTKDRFSIDYAAEALAGGRFGHRIGLRIR